MTAPPPSRPSPSPARWRRPLLAAAWLALALHFGQPASTVLSPTLDSSIHASYTYFLTHGFQFGPEVNTTAGPYGFVPYGWDYSGELYWTRWGFTQGFALALSALCLWVFRAARGGWARWLWLAGLLFAVPASDNLYNLPALLAGLFFLLTSARPVSRVALFGVAALLALNSLTKGTSVGVATAVLGVVALQALWQRSWRHCAWIAGSFLVALLGWWSAAGQNPLHLPRYLQGVWHISTGYNQAMFLNEPAAQFRDGLALAAGLLAWLGWFGWRHRAERTLLPVTLLVGGLAFVAWKHGFVRADNHSVIFYDFALVIALTLPLVERAASPAPAPRRVLLGHLAGLALVVGLYGSAIERLAPGRIRLTVEGYRHRWLDNARFAFAPERIEPPLHRQLLRRRADHALPATARLVGDRTIDFFGHDFGSLLLSELNYWPAPMCCGTYHVYNRHFKELNAAHFASPRRPDFILLAAQTIDDRWLPADDSLSLLTLLRGYRPVHVDTDLTTDKDLLLLAARDSVPTAPPPRPLGTRTFALGESIPVPEAGPDELVLFALDAPASWRGQLRSLLYKPALLSMDLIGDHLSAPKDRRIIPAGAAVPSLLSPAVEDLDDVLALLSGGVTKTVRSLRFHSPSPSTFAPGGLRIHFSAVPRPPTVSAPIPRVYLRGRHSGPPGTATPDQPPLLSYRGRLVRYLHAPSSLTYDLVGQERSLQLRLGMDEGAYRDGHTDGVDLYVELLLPDGTVQVLARRDLRPATIAADRGLLFLNQLLPPWFPPDTRLRLRSDPGPHGDSGWDWLFVSSVALRAGPLLPGQFPGFATTPTAVGPAPCGAMPDGTGRNVVVFSPPASVEFVLDRSPQRLTFIAGLLPGSYQNDGHTDGVDFIAEIVARDGTTRPVGTLALRPAEQPADRGDRVATFSLPATTAGERLRLRADPGPYRSLAWDWSYLSHLHLE